MNIFQNLSVNSFNFGSKKIVDTISPDFVINEIKKGSSLTSIAYKLGCSVSTLRNFNRIHGIYFPVSSSRNEAIDISVEDLRAVSDGRMKPEECGAKYNCSVNSVLIKRKQEGLASIKRQKIILPEKEDLENIVQSGNVASAYSSGSGISRSSFYRHLSENLGHLTPRQEAVKKSQDLDSNPEFIAKLKSDARSADIAKEFGIPLRVVQRKRTKMKNSEK